MDTLLKELDKEKIVLGGEEFNFDEVWVAELRVYHGRIEVAYGGEIFENKHQGPDAIDAVANRICEYVKKVAEQAKLGMELNYGD